MMIINGEVTVTKVKPEEVILSTPECNVLRSRVLRRMGTESIEEDRNIDTTHQA